MWHAKVFITPQSMLSRATFSCNHSCKSFVVCLSQLCTSRHWIFAEVRLDREHLWIANTTPELWSLICSFYYTNVFLSNHCCPARSWTSALFSSFFFANLSFIFLYFKSTRSSLPAPPEEKHPHGMMLPPPCFTVGMLCWGWCYSCAVSNSVFSDDGFHGAF